MVIGGSPIDWIVSTPIAHRGFHDASRGAPENSLPAFRRSLEAGFPIELDVQLTADEQIVVFHDHNLSRMTGSPKVLAQCSLEELSRLSLLGTEEKIPTLTQVFEIVDGRVPLLIELKNVGAPGPLEERLVDALARCDGSYAVMSFNPQSLAFFKEHDPATARGQVSGSLSDAPGLPEETKKALQALQFNGLTEPSFIAYELAFLPHPAVDAAKAAGLPVLAWTVRAEDEVANARKLADNYIFEGFKPPGPATR